MEQMQSLEALEAEVTRLTLMAGNLEESLAAMEERLASPGSGEVERVVAAVEYGGSEKMEALEARLAEAEQQIVALQAAATAMQANTATNSAVQPGRRTVGANAAQLLAKHGIGEGATDVASIDAALTSLPIEQRIAVKSQLLRAGLLG
jgi:hypothetical protein